MVRIAIFETAFAAITSTLPLGSVGYENQINERGERTARRWDDPKATLARALFALASWLAMAGTF